MHPYLKPLTLLMAFILILAVVIGPSAEASPTNQGNSVTIGYLGDADSDLARGVQLAINEINNSGGISATNGLIYTLRFEAVPVATASDVPAALEQLSNATVIYGPETDTLAVPNIAALSSAGIPILTSARSNDIVDQDTSNNIFQIAPVAGEYGRALATYLAQELGVTSVVAINVLDDFNDNSDISAFSTTFSSLQQPPSQMIQVNTQEQLIDGLVGLAGTTAEAVIVFGDAASADLTLAVLREGGWNGIFVYQDAQQALLADELQIDVAAFTGVIGADNWTFGPGTAVGRTFVANYVTQYGDVPGPLSVAGYDSLYALFTLFRTGNVSPAVVRNNLNQVRLTSLVAGAINPFVYGNRQLSRTVYVYELTGTGGAEAIAIYDAGVLRAGALDNDSVVDDTGGDDTGSPTQVAAATATLVPTATFFQPSATPSVLTATVKSNVGALRVRGGPSTGYPVVDELARGQQVTIIGRNQDFTWYFIQYQGRTGWISAEFVDVFDPGNQLAALSLVAAPATPSPSPSPRPSGPDLIIRDVTLSPQQPEPGSPVIATIVIENVGLTDAGGFAIATSFRPGDVYTANTLSGLAAGQTITTTLSNVISSTGYVPDLGIIVDLNNNVNEGTEGENNNLYTIAYKVDRTTVSEAQAVLSPAGSINFYGANVDLSWDGTTFTASTISGMARIGAVGAGLDFVTAHYDVVSTYATGTSYSNPAQGQTFAIITDEGDYGYLQVNSFNGSNVTFTYRIYTP